MPVTVRVPHGMAWCVDGCATVEARGSTLRELWKDLHHAFPELMWRLSLEQGPPSFWVRNYINDRRFEAGDRFDIDVPDGSVVTLHVIDGTGPMTGPQSDQPELVGWTNSTSRSAASASGRRWRRSWSSSSSRAWPKGGEAGKRRSRSTVRGTTGCS